MRELTDNNVFLLKIKFTGQDTYRCMANGDWSPKVPPVCMKLEQNTFQGEILFLENLEQRNSTNFES